jgi:hypothetical protein
MLIFGERHLRHVLAVYADHYVRHEAPLDHVEVKGRAPRGAVIRVRV